MSDGRDPLRLPRYHTDRRTTVPLPRLNSRSLRPALKSQSARRDKIPYFQRYNETGPADRRPKLPPYNRHRQEPLPYRKPYREALHTEVYSSWTYRPTDLPIPSAGPFPYTRDNLSAESHSCCVRRCLRPPRYRELHRRSSGAPRAGHIQNSVHAADRTVRIGRLPPFRGILQN